MQNSVVAYNSLTLAYLLILGIGAQLIGIFVFWTVQKRYGLSTKFMFNIVMLGILLLDGWGMVGSKSAASKRFHIAKLRSRPVWTQSFGFHHEWEFYLYQAVYGR